MTGLSEKKDEKTLAECRKEEATYYEQAYEGFLKAIASENFPMCGMEESTVNLLMANMAYKLGKVDIASRFISIVYFNLKYITQVFQAATANPGHMPHKQAFGLLFPTIRRQPSSLRSIALCKQCQQFHCR